MHKNMSNLLIFIFTVLLPVIADADDSAISRLFDQKGVDGTVVIASLRSGQTFVHNEFRAKQRFSPASTFKIMNTLIAVEEGAVASKSDVFEWDGHIYAISDWNHDQTLLSAFKVSCVWCYQELARRVGTEKYESYLKQSDYGELQSEFSTTMFWLDGSLQISAREQINFLRKAFLQQLPFGERAYEILQQIMLEKKTPAYSLWAKTGWATRVKPQVGWYVGYIETSKDVWLFALNMELGNAKDLPLRQELVLDAMRSKGIID
jgi:beta-lactamase class D